MTMIRKCWTGIREMNKYESTRGGMRSLELLMTFCRSCWNIWKDSQYKDSNGENFAVFGR